ncbi:MAG: hypothetical protein RhofKO_09840 [Rhodothermales bacterium]
MIDALRAVAERWSDPDYAPRQAAVAEMLALEAPFTEEAITFALNQAMYRIGEDVTYIAESSGGRIAIQTEEEVPLARFREAVFALVAGDCIQLIQPDPLEVAFWTEVNEVAGNSCIMFEANDPTRWVMRQADPEPDAIRLRYGVAVMGEDETDEAWEGLAEDILLHEGFGEANVRLLFAPQSLAPDVLLDHLAQMRGVLPADASTPSRLKMPQAFLAAAKTPHGYGEGLEFLVSRGEAEVQEPAHLRWVPYTSLDEVRTWIRTHRADVSCIISTQALGRPTIEPGTAHRQPLLVAVDV